MPRPLCDSEYLFGLHDPGGEYLMAERGKRGWILFTERLGADPADRSGYDYSRWSNQGFGVIVRLNHGYEPDGTIPPYGQYENFARRCANFVAASRGAHIWIIGNEPNHPAERPGVRLDHSAWPPTVIEPGQVITPAMYAQAYRLCREAIRALPGHTEDQVLVAGPAPWNTQTTYPGNEAGDWVRYLRDVLAILEGPDNCDGLALHTYTHGADPALISSEERVSQPPFTAYRWHFRAYQDFLAVVPPNMRHLPAYITETNQGDDPWLDRNSGWVQRAYGEIDAWNRNPDNQAIRALILYRWPQVSGDRWGIQGKNGVIDDFRAAMQNDYKWRPTPPAPSYRVRWLAHNTPAQMPQRQTVTVSLQLRNAGFNRWVKDGQHPVRLGYRWFRASQPSGPPVGEGIAANLPHDVPSGGEVTLTAQVVVPEALGPYLLKWDLVEHGIAWFAERGSATLDVAVQVAEEQEYTHPLTGKVIRGPFLRFYRQYTETITGAPISDQLVDPATHLNTQYFQRVVLEEYEQDKIRLKAAGEAMYTWGRRIAELQAEVERLRSITGAGVPPPPMQNVVNALPRDADRFHRRTALDVRYIVINHTAVSPDVPLERIAAAHRQRGWPGISYQYFVDGNGQIFQTEPLEEAISADQPWLAQGVNIGVAGNFDETIPTDAQMDALSRLVAWLLQELGLARDAVVGVRELISSGSPGEQWLSGRRWKDILLNQVQNLLAAAPSAGAAATIARLRAELRQAQDALAEARSEAARLRDQVVELQRRLAGGAPPRPAIEDVINSLPRDPNGFAYRSLESIRYVVINHTAGDPNIPLQRIAEYHRQSFPGITYTYFIDAQGKIFQTEPWDVIADPNRIYLVQGINVCVAGNFDEVIPNDAQMDSCARLCAWLLHDRNLPLSALVGVRELVPTHGSPGRQWLTGQRWKDLLVNRVRAILEAAAAGSEDDVETLRRQIAELQAQLQQARARIAELEAEIERLRGGGAGVQPPPMRDVVDALPKHPTLRYETRPRGAISHLAIHHSAAAGDLSPQAIAEYHVNSRGWPGIGYHYYIPSDGTVYWTNRLETISYHVADNNGHTVGICLGGNFIGTVPTAAQLDSAARLIAWLMQELQIPLERVWGHRQYPNNSTSCPGDQWLSGAKWRDGLFERVRRLRGG
jgi:N-acetyl-anhydromuramyl-L-alanine amidase AmpD